MLVQALCLCPWLPAGSPSCPLARLYPVPDLPILAQFLDWSRFSLRLAEAEVESMHSVLAATAGSPRMKELQVGAALRCPLPAGNLCSAV